MIVPSSQNITVLQPIVDDIDRLRPMPVFPHSDHKTRPKTGQKRAENDNMMCQTDADGRPLAQWWHKEPEAAHVFFLWVDGISVRVGVRCQR